MNRQTAAVSNSEDEAAVLLTPSDEDSVHRGGVRSVIYISVAIYHHAENPLV